MAPPTADSTKDVEKKSTQRRINKPLIEKRRRARINECLAQLKAIVLEANSESKTSQPSKLEKADILEMTVEFLKRKKTAHELEEETVSSNKAVSQSEYTEGYSKCLREISNFLEQTRSITSDFKRDIVNHISTKITKDKTINYSTHGSSTFVDEQTCYNIAVKPLNKFLNQNSSNSEVLDLRINTTKQKIDIHEPTEASHMCCLSEPTNHSNSLNHVTNNQLPIGLLYGGQLMLILQVPLDTTSQQSIANGQVQTIQPARTLEEVGAPQCDNVTFNQNSNVKGANTVQIPTSCQTVYNSIQYDSVNTDSMDKLHTLENKNTNVGTSILQQVNTPTLSQSKDTPPSFTIFQLMNNMPTVSNQNNEDLSSHWRPW